MLSISLASEILPKHLERPLSIDGSAATNVRGDQAVRRRPERIIRGQRLRIRNIKCCAADLLALQSFNKGGLVNDLAAADVGDVGAGGVDLVEEGEFLGGQEVRCFLSAKRRALASRRAFVMRVRVCGVRLG